MQDIEGGGDVKYPALDERWALLIATLQDCMKTNPDMPLSDLYYRLFQSTVGSHVNVYGIKGYGSLYTHTLREIL